MLCLLVFGTEQRYETSQFYSANPIKIEPMEKTVYFELMMQIALEVTSPARRVTIGGCPKATPDDMLFTRLRYFADGDFESM